MSAADASTRLNVNVGEPTMAALRNVSSREGISLTEALRRLVGYGDFVYRAVREQGATVLVSTGDSVREVVLL